jgi:hypothetical protein
MVECCAGSEGLASGIDVVMIAACRSLDAQFRRATKDVRCRRASRQHDPTGAAECSQ